MPPDPPSPCFLLSNLLKGFDLAKPTIPYCDFRVFVILEILFFYNLVSCTDYHVVLRIIDLMDQALFDS